MATKKAQKPSIALAKKMQTIRAKREATEKKIKKLEQGMQVLDKQLDTLIHEVVQCV